MTRVIILILSLFLLNHCSFNENSRIWKDKEKNLESKKNIKKVFSEEKKISSEFNQELKLDLTKIKTNNRIIDNKNNYGSQKYGGLLKKIGTYKFGKFEEINQLNFKPVFLDNGLIFFDKKGSIIKFDNDSKIIWKNNYYTKSEKKLSPQLSFAVKGKNLLVVDNIRKVFSINIDTGKLNWSKINGYPFNSDIKISKDSLFAVDYNNTLRCFKLEDGSECWNLITDSSLTIPNKKYSIILVKNLIIFNNSIGDITAVDVSTGLIVWQLPTQSSSIYNETYYFKTSELVTDGKSLYFSNNKNEFYSVDIQTGSVNWKNKVNSDLTPIIIENFIFTISNDGYLFTIQKKQGNIIRINDLYKNYKKKIKEKFNSNGFLIGKDKIYLSNNENLSVISLKNGKIIKNYKVARGKISAPYILNNNLYLIKNGSIIKYD